MKVSKNPYSEFSNFVLRTPLLPFEFYKTLTSKKEVTTNELKTACANPVIKEAIFLASPSLLFEMEKWLANDLDSDKEEKLKHSLLKYITRMTTRCTPFGIFAGCATGTLEENTLIKLDSFTGNKRYTRLDMNYLVALSQDLAKNDSIKKQLLFYPNSSLYTSGNEWRYVEYNYINSKRNHYVSAVDNTKYLNAILEKSIGGAKLSDMVPYVADNFQVSFEDAESFLNELVESQILISDLEPSVSGPEFLSQILEILSTLDNTQHHISSLKKIELELHSLDTKFGNDPKKYVRLSEYINTLGTSFEIKYLYQSDMELRPEQCSLSLRHIESIKKGMVLLNKLSATSPSPNLTAFRDSFRERYEDREISLAKALDVEIGIGYLQNQGSGDVNPLVDSLVLPPLNSNKSSNSFNWNENFQILFDKLQESHNRGVDKVVLKDEDFKDASLNWTDLPDTLSTMIELVVENGIEKIVFSGAGGSSAANLLARFGQGNEQIKKTIQEITVCEETMNPDKVIAEIVHLPESRIGNILSRPSLRTYEIPYLAKSVLEREQQLTLDDLFISIRNNKVFLRSKKLNKEVLPRLTNAHNYSFNSLPIYHFLCDLQSSNNRSGIGFTLGPISELRKHLPRVEYENLILHEARWTIEKNEIQSMQKVLGDTNKLLKAAKDFCALNKMQQYVLLVEGDNELLINFKNSSSIRMFVNEIRNRERFVLKEFLYGDNGVLESKEGYYTNQMVVSFFNSKKITNTD
ncbi:hypothetical protein FEE95_06815 [Maribacter algarum]|uniref:Lantibiotic dehydratase N-terminal domain-containing protein n=1 Tax=Maribacter algarum (ex Zhang et al. 2020) TaxID=2578118 RepID=A0A5S3Q0N2_9FLAO|nr:lantibiotic dehydratase family protein [Maribacter algarum]TMM59137.1 hypothetical protein FEE95_06815 [Maribacter algarum]